MHTQQIVNNLPIVPGGVHNICLTQNSKSDGYILLRHLNEDENLS